MREAMEDNNPQSGTQGWLDPASRQQPAWAFAARTRGQKQQGCQRPAQRLFQYFSSWIALCLPYGVYQIGEV